MLCSVLTACGDDAEVVDESVEAESLGVAILTQEAKDNIFSLNSDLSGTFNPYSDSSTLNQMFMPLIYDNLFDVDSSFVATPKLIKSYSTTDGISWTFYVDTSVKFHDGSTLTAYDAAYSLNRAQWGETYGSRLSKVYGVTAIDDEYFMVTLAYSDMQFPSLLNIPVVKYDSVGETAPAGTGAYMMNDELNALVLWDEHELADDMPIDTIYLKQYSDPEETIEAFDSSLIDLVNNDPTGLSDLGYGSTNEVRYCATTNMHYIGFNQGSSFFCYSKFRYFLTFAIDRSTIVSDHMGGAATATTLPMSPSSSLYNSTYASSFEFDMTKAGISLANAGAADYDDDGMLEFMMGSVMVDVKIDFLVCGDTATKVTAAREIASRLTELGIEVNMRELGWTDYLQALADGDYDMYYAEVKLSPDFDLSSILLETGTLNYGAVDDSGTADYISQFLSSTDEDRQMNADYMFKYITETAPIVPICFEKTEVLTHRGVVTGASPTQYNIFNNFQNWTIELN